MYKRKRPCKPGYVQYSDGFIDPTTNKRRIVTVSFKSVSKRVDERVARKLLDEKMKEVMAKEGTVYGKLHLHELILMRVEWLNKFYKPQTAISAKWHLASIEKRLGDPIVENLTL